MTSRENLLNVFYVFNLYTRVHLLIVCSYTKVTKVYSKILVMKSLENDFISLPAFNLIMCLMKAPKNLFKIVIFKPWTVLIETVLSGDSLHLAFFKAYLVTILKTLMSR